MSATTVTKELHDAQAQIADPGSAGTITVDRSMAVVNLVSAGAEARTLALPTRQGVVIKLHMQTDGGDITLTVASAFNEVGDTTFTFSDVGQFVEFTSFMTSAGVYFWRLTSHYALANISPTEIMTLDGQTLTTGAGVGITAGTGTIYKNSVRTIGGIYYTSIMIDLTGLGSSTTDLDVIGVAGGPAYIAQVTAAQQGTTILMIRMTCLEAPATGVTDIDLYSAVEATPVFDDGIAASTETALITSGGAWTNGTAKGATTVPAANEYLYLTCGAAGTVGTYTAGKFLIEIYGY